MILAGDIGGTSTRLALFDGDRQPHDVREYSSQKYAGLAEVIAEYLGVSPDAAAASTLAKGRFDRACFGVAGPVESGPNGSYVRGTNLSWSVSQADLAKTFGLPRESVGVINDLAANATGVAEVAPGNLVTLQAGEPVVGHRAIISAGTGLGEGGLFWDGKDHHPIPSEGGHSSFGPRNELQDDMLRYLRAKDAQIFRGHVSWERVLSGPGMYNVFDYLRHAGVAEQKLQLDPAMKPGDAAKLISKAALEDTCPRAAATMDLFVSLYGAAAGNLAITILALGGLYVGGGIAPKIIEKLKAPAFMEAFVEKGPLRDSVLKKVPVRVIMDEHTALRGAARYARLKF